jgi:hypothetical protein
MTEEQYKYRATIRPIWFRRLNALWSGELILDVLFFGFFIASLVLWIGIVGFSQTHETELEVEDIEYFEDMNKLSLLYELYTEVQSITLLFLIYRTMKYIELNKKIGFLS